MQFGEDKCKKLHIGRKNHMCPDLFVDTWKLEKEDENKKGINNLKDVFSGDYLMEEVDSVKYLGDILSMDGKNKKNIESRKGKAWGAVRQIISILNETCFGPFYFEMAMVLRNSLLINSMLTNSEAWYGLTKNDIEELESVDLFLMRKIFEVPFSCPKEMFYLETGCMPINYIIMSRRVMFFHSILHEEKDSMIYRFLKAQMENPDKGDWILDVKKNFEELNITESVEEIHNMSKLKFQKIVKKAVRAKSFSDLLKLKDSHTKVKNINFKNFEMQKYLKTKILSNHEVKFAFHTRSRMLDVKCNYSHSYTNLSCPACRKDAENDTQTHLLKCEALLPQNVVSTGDVEYHQLFCKNVETQVIVIKILKNIFPCEKNHFKRGENKFKKN